MSDEIIQTLDQRVDKGFDTVYRASGQLRKTRDTKRKVIAFYLKKPVRAEAGRDDQIRVTLHGEVMGQIVQWIVCGAHKLNLHTAQQPPGAEIIMLQCLIRVSPYVIQQCRVIISFRRGRNTAIVQDVTNDGPDS